MDKKLENEILSKCNLRDPQLRSEAVAQLIVDRHESHVADHVRKTFISCLRIAKENDMSIDDLLGQFDTDDDDAD